MRSDRVRRPAPPGAASADDAGGACDFAGARRVKLIRGGDTSRHDVSDDAAEDPELQAVDIVSVPSGG